MKSLHDAREHYEAVRRTAEAEIRAEVGKRIEGARYEMARTAHMLKAAGASVSALAEDYGTKDRGTIYRLLNAYEFASDVVNRDVADMVAEKTRAHITWEMLEDNVVQITGTNIPVEFWTFESDRTPRPTEPVDNTLVLELSGVYGTPRQGIKEPLWVEWRNGTALDYVKDELGFSTK